MTPDDPHAWFPQFYENPAIRALADARRWTISGQIGDDLDKPPTRKAPVDIRHLLSTGRVRGAWATDEACLVTLDELTRAVPDAANNAFYLQAQTDGLVVLDIEPSCPPEVAADLLRLPGTLYSELSMSGKGFHLLAALPRNFHDFPVAAAKRVLREEHRWYELLLDHWVTLTRRPIPEEIVASAGARSRPTAFASFEDLYAELATKARESAAGSASDIETTVEMPEIPYAQEIVQQTLATARHQLRAPEDFDHDLSRWEFSVLASLHAWMMTQIRAYNALSIEYSPSDIAWLLYRAALEIIPARPKHGQRRNGRPFLLDRAAALVADREAAAPPDS
ncbi:hypothetical protein C8K30_1011028 [Promicromonospora sp. AC04]|uniref:hypothetical protein n=1 Tax=Promicromonospora sp. AC04 TaxID=2135723 RepID=UPI000D39D343|nr:hypothetical protein [Promicromonospora sp. AC04]PUB32502.1 hypothetical protein C8K30_1011028 [Promicromonospora sp. AC04]